ncbi:hypothetical protein [Sanguibacter sp. 25GB23B1]|uniref:hypothetical protein n=1 Tax=unclassified Sanguibacter TaxID=2645534 RepID=UPI0032AEE9D2
MRGRRAAAVGLAMIGALVTACSTQDARTGAPANGDPPGVVLPAPQATQEDPHSRLLAAIDAFVEASSDFPTDAALTPEQAAIVDEAYAVATELSTEAYAATGTTLVVVFPVYATMPGLPFGTFWTSTHPAVTGVGLTTTWYEHVARLDEWVRALPAGSGYETLVQPPSPVS